jgi:hypothetical protein
MRVKLLQIRWAMNRIFLFIAMISYSGVVAQGEFLNKSNSLSGTGIKSPNSSGIAKPSVFSPKSATPNTSSSKQKPIEEKPLQFTQKNDFADAGQPVMTKLNSQSETDFNPVYVNKNMDFGILTTKSGYVRICYRDYSAPDGDMVRIYTNDMMLVPTTILGVDCAYMKLTLLKGENVINFEALNEGSSYPNTGELQVFDEMGKVLASKRWGLETGYKGILTVYKE